MSCKDTFSLLDKLDNGFYIKGYTEALYLFSDVRVIEEYGQVIGFFDRVDEYINRVGLPCYCIPVFLGNKCYGYIFKGVSKFTARYPKGLYYTCGIARVKEGDTVVLVEGIKDTYR